MQEAAVAAASAANPFPLREAARAGPVLQAQNQRAGDLPQAAVRRAAEVQALQKAAVVIQHLPRALRAVQVAVTTPLIVPGL